MANETLIDVFSDIADAVRAKGVTGQMTPLQMPAKITSIPSGGETPEAEWKDVNFIDYDGKNLYSYTTAEALALTELPPAPDRTSKGLTFQEWNYTLAEMKANANDTGKCTAGAIYFPTDGKTHLFITLPDEKFVGVQIPVGVQSGYFDTIEVDWGDGNTDSLTGGGWKTFDHTYNTNVFPSSYEIKVHTTGGLAYSLSDDGIFSSPSLPTTYVRNSIIDKIYFGTKAKTARCIRYNLNLKEVVIPNNLTDKTILCDYTGSLYGIVCPSEAVVSSVRGSTLQVISI